MAHLHLQSLKAEARAKGRRNRGAQPCVCGRPISANKLLCLGCKTILTETKD